jgi:hypothetical protein
VVRLCSDAPLGRKEGSSRQALATNSQLLQLSWTVPSGGRRVRDRLRLESRERAVFSRIEMGGIEMRKLCVERADVCEDEIDICEGGRDGCEDEEDEREVKGDECGGEADYSIFCRPRFIYRVQIEEQAGRGGQHIAGLGHDGFWMGAGIPERKPRISTAA